jgi:hypothetical protein
MVTKYHGSELHLKNSRFAREKAKEWHNKQKEKRINEYNLNPKLCEKCNKPIDYKRKVNKYCGSSCSASVTNKKRDTRTEESRKKISDAIKRFYDIHGRNTTLSKRPDLKKYPSTVITYKDCPVCEKIFITKNEIIAGPVRKFVI